MRGRCWRRSSPGTWWGTCRRCSGWPMPTAGTGPRGPRGMRSRPGTSRNRSARPGTHRCGRASRSKRTAGAARRWSPAFKSDYIVFGNRCTLGVDSWVNYGVTMQDGSSLGADALLMKGEDVPENTIYSGNPSRGVTSPVAPKPLAAVVSGSLRHGVPRHGGARHREAVAAPAGLVRLSKATCATHGTHRASKAARTQVTPKAEAEDKAGTPGSGS